MRLVVAAGGIALLALVVVGWTAFAGCPQALLSGQLVRDGATLVVDVGGGQRTNVRWPFGYGIHEGGGKLFVTDLFGSVKAREGDTVHLGGGMVGSNEDAFGVCGDYTVDPA